MNGGRLDRATNLCCAAGSDEAADNLFCPSNNTRKRRGPYGPRRSCSSITP